MTGLVQALFLLPALTLSSDLWLFSDRVVALPARKKLTLTRAHCLLALLLRGVLFLRHREAVPRVLLSPDLSFCTTRGAHHFVLARLSCPAL